MKITPTLFGFLAVATLAACHHDHSGSTSMPPPPGAPPSTSMNITSSQLLGTAQQTSETANPFAVNEGALSIIDTSETSTPIAVSAN